MAYSDDILATSGLVSYWRLGDTGTTAVDGPGLNDGTVSGATTGAIGITGGGANAAMTFDGVNDLVTIPHDAGLVFAGDFTVEAWFKPSAVSSSFPMALVKATGTSLAARQYGLYINSANKWVGTIPSSAANNQITHTASGSTTAYQHLVLILRGTVIEVWVNNVKASATVVGTPYVQSAVAGSLYFGANVSTTYWPGDIDEVAIYNVALADATIASHYTAGTTSPGQFVSDTFTDTDGTNIVSHTGETGATWTLKSSGANPMVVRSNRVVSEDTVAGRRLWYTASGTPATANYDVDGTLYIASVTAGLEGWFLARAEVNAETGYVATRRSDGWRIVKLVTGTYTSLGAWVNTPTVGATETVKLEIRENSQKLSIDGTLRISATDSVITAIGKVGVGAVGIQSASTGFHVDSVSAFDLVQVARPTADVTDGTWTDQAGGVSLFAAIDEVTASDADYIQSAIATLTADVSEISLGTITDPAVSTGHIIRYRYGKDAVAGDVVNLTVSLRQGTATEIAAWTHTDIGVGPITVAQTLTALQADAVTDYSALRLRFSSVKV